MSSELKIEAYHDGFNSKLFKILPQSSRKVLELGCGTGRLGQYYKQANPKSIWHAVEFNNKASMLAKTRIDRVWSDDINHLDKLDLDDDYDLIVMGDILEHLTDPENTIKALTKRTTEDAYLCICTPNAGHLDVVKRLLCGDFSYDEAGLLDRTHRKFFSRSSLFKMLLDQLWLPHQCDEYTSTLQNDDFTKVIVQACEHLGLPKLTAVKNLSQIQHVVSSP